MLMFLLTSACKNIIKLVPVTFLGTWKQGQTDYIINNILMQVRML